MIKWVIRLAVITVLLGLVGTVVIIFHLRHSPRHHQPRRNQQPTHPSVTAASAHSALLKPARAETLISPRPAVVKNEVADTTAITKKDSIQKTHSAAARAEQKTTMFRPTEPIKPENHQPAPKKQPKQNLLNREELKQLARRTSMVKLKNGIYSNCVQLCVTADADNKKTMSQVEKYLKSHHYTIAGREVVEAKVKGIKVTPAGSCVRITIGSF